MSQSDLLRLRIKLARFTPHERILELRGETAMYTMTNRFDGRALTETDRIAEIGYFTSFLRIHSVGC